MADRRLLLLRHAQAVELAPGLRDHQRPLTDFGIEQAISVGRTLRARGVSVDHVLCSSAMRTRQTWKALSFDADVEYSDAVYNAGSESLLESIHDFDGAVRSAMIIGHGPGLPRLATELAGAGSDRHALEVINNHYPVATVCEYEVDEPWAELSSARLCWTRIGA